MTDTELKLKEFNHQLRMNWAEDHGYIQNLCRKHGFSKLEVEGDSWGVPDIQNLADLLDKRIEELKNNLSTNNCGDETVSDGFGGEWSEVCPMCKDISIHVVRPGKVQCYNCD